MFNIGQAAQCSVFNPAHPLAERCAFLVSNDLSKLAGTVEYT
jgi:hypothetical protein